MNDYLLENIENILQNLSIEYELHHNRITMPCPIHGSDNSESVSLLLEGNTVSGIWKCWTNHCEKNCGNNIFGLIKGVLSIDKEVTNKDVFKWIEGHVGKVPKSDVSLNKYLSLVADKPELPPGIITRDYIRRQLSRPASNFLNRGFDEKLLDKYDIGVCKTKQKEMFMRTVVPVYDEDYQFMIGCLGRSNNNQCPKCSLYHYHSECPANKLEKRWAAKWINSNNFYAGNYLFNLWFAKKHIYQKQSVILVEGILDVLKLESAGIHNSLAIFGCDLTYGQQEIINSLPVHTLIIAMDNDVAGIEGASKINTQTERYFNTKVIHPVKKDWDTHTTQEIQEILGYI